MSFAYGSTAFLLPVTSIPDRFESADEVLQFISDSTVIAYDEAVRIEASIPMPLELNTPENRFKRNREIEEKTFLASYVLRGSSRSGWFERVVGNIALACGLRHLGFLTDNEDSAPYVWPDENWRYRFTVLDESEVVLVKRDVEEVMGLSRRNPQRIGDLTEDGWSGEDVLEAISEKGVAHNPMLVFGDEGESPSYLFAFLRGLLAILEKATESKHVVVYYQKHPD